MHIKFYWNAEVYWNIKLNIWWCFAKKYKDWNVSEVENEDVILLIKDYIPVEETIQELTVEEISKRLWYEVKVVK